MNNSSKIRCNGQKVRQLRRHLSMTQEKLAHMSKVDPRTVQRAEASELLQLETIASMADALKVTVSDITSTEHTSVEDNDILPEAAERNAVVLRRVTSGRVLTDLICGSFSGALYCAAEPTNDNIDLLSSLVEKLEGLIPDPWESPMEASPLSLAGRLREALNLTAKLTELEKLGVAVFAGTYTARAQIPHFDMDEGMMLTNRNQRFEPVTVCRVSLNPLGVERVTVKVTDEWIEPSSAFGKSLDKLEIDDDIPF